MVVKINGVDHDFNVAENVSIVEFAKNAGVDVPTLCFLKDCGNVAKCGLCGVLVDGKKTLACKTPVEDGMEILTPFITDPDAEDPANAKQIPNEDAPELSEFLKTRISKMLETHNFACGKCVRKSNCEFLDLVMLTKARAETPFRPTEEEVAALTDSRSQSIVLDRSKCVTCARCVAACAVKTTTESITLGKLPEEVGTGRGVCPALKDTVNGAPSENVDDKTVASPLSFDDTNCLLCGQCVAACPVGALQEQSHVERVEEALADPTKHVVVAPAPAVRATLGELFGLPLGTDVTGLLYSSLRELGFDRVFDINFAADLTIMEEGTELLGRLANGGTFPMFTSCCPGWIRLIDNYAPELRPNLSTAKSPQQSFGAAAKAYYPTTSGAPEGLDPKDVYVVTVMPCVAKKFEAQRDGMYGASGDPSQPDVDAVLTVRELARLITKNKIDFTALPDGVADPGLGEYTGAGTIFGVTGGVMEAAIRSAKDIAEGVDLEGVDYEAVEGFDGVREATVDVAGTGLKVAVVNGAANFFALQKSGKLDSYHFVEVMACPGGCIGGGGQPHVDAIDKLDNATGADGCPVSGHFAGTGDNLPDYIAKRASVLRGQDKNGNFTDQKRKSHQNAEITAMYEALGVAPGEGVAHKLFHHAY
jgi:iron-only hydrogenase group A